MAIEKQNLLAERTQNAFPRIKPANVAGAVQVRTYSESAGAELLKVGTPLVFDNAAGNTGQVRPWVDADGGVRDIIGFVYDRDVQLDTTNEVLGNVMQAGMIHYDDVQLNGQTQGTLDTALRSDGVRLAGLYIDGLAEKL